MRMMRRFTSISVGISMAVAACAATAAPNPSLNWVAFNASECGFLAAGTDSDYWGSDETDFACFDFGVMPTFEPEVRTMLVPEEPSGPAVKG